MGSSSQRLVRGVGFCFLLLVGYFVGESFFVKAEATPSNFRRLHKGMTKGQIERTLGPEGYFSTMWPGNFQTWKNGPYEIQIYYSGDLAASGSISVNGSLTERLAEEGVFGRIRRWVKDWTGW